MQRVQLQVDVDKQPQMRQHVEGGISDGDPTIFSQQPIGAAGCRCAGA